MGVRVSIGDFAIMAHLSRKALRHYHELGILEPAHIDAATGYRYYDTSQVDQAQLIRRFRSLEMSIPDIKALLSAGDAASRTTIIANHLRRMEEQLAQTTNAVAELRELLEPMGPHPRVELRHEPAAAVWSIRAVVDSAARAVSSLANKPSRSRIRCLRERNTPRRTSAFRLEGF